jgi:hypothetical protein
MPTAPNLDHNTNKVSSSAAIIGRFDAS